MPTDIEEIHNTSMKLLANVGVEFPDDEAIAVLKGRGFKTDGHRVYFSEEQVMGALETVPAQFTIHARNPDKDVTVGDGEPVSTRDRHHPRNTGLRDHSQGWAWRQLPDGAAHREALSERVLAASGLQSGGAGGVAGGRTAGCGRPRSPPPSPAQQCGW